MTLELFGCFGNPMRELFQSRHFVGGGFPVDSEGSDASVSASAAAIVGEYFTDADADDDARTSERATQRLGRRPRRCLRRRAALSLLLPGHPMCFRSLPADLACGL